MQIGTLQQFFTCEYEKWAKSYQARVRLDWRLLIINKYFWAPDLHAFIPIKNMETKPWKQVFLVLFPLWRFLDIPAPTWFLVDNQDMLFSRKQLDRLIVDIWPNFHPSLIWQVKRFQEKGPLEETGANCQKCNPKYFDQSLCGKSSSYYKITIRVCVRFWGGSVESSCPLLEMSNQENYFHCNSLTGFLFFRNLFVLYCCVTI